MDYILNNDELRCHSSKTSRDSFIIPVNPDMKLSYDFSLKSKKKGKILVVDDNQFVVEATVTQLRKVLKEAGSDMEIIVGCDGSDIIHHIVQDQSKGNEIKLILTDENMEYLNGSDAIRIIRNLENRQKVKFVNIITITSNEDPYYIDEIKRAGAQIVLNKPLSKSVIARVLKEYEII